MTEDDITPAMVTKVTAMGEMVIKATRKIVSMVFGPGYVPVIILALNGDPKQLAILADIDSKCDLMAILRSAADRADTGEMMDKDNAPKEH